MKNLGLNIVLTFQWLTANILGWFRYPLFIIFCLHFLLLQFHLLFKGVHSDDKFFYWESGDVEYWVLDLCYKLATVVLISGVIIAGTQKARLSAKQGIQIGIYGLSALKDCYDFVLNGNHGTIFIDWAVVFSLLFFLEFLWPVAVKKVERYKIKYHE